MFITKTLSSFVSRFIAALLIVALALAMFPAMPAGAVGTQVTLTTGTSWTVPAGVTNISIECWGGGGNGGNATYWNRIGGGGGGGAYAKVLSYAVTPGAVIPISIGAGGGGNTTFNTSVCVADGGANGTAGAIGGNGAGGAGGLASASTGDIKTNGGSGSYAGGGSAGVTALGLLSATAIAGNNASSCTPGTAVANGGAGGSSNCLNQTRNGFAGGFPGGGGASMGGGGSATTGGAGAQGRIVITYLPIITTPTVTGIGTTSATLGANFVSANGATTVSARGICWGTTPAPTTNCTSSGTATGVYTQSVSGFTAGTLYYYRGYVTVESGTGYSEDGTFTADTTLAVTAPSSITYPATGTLTTSGGSSGGTVSFSYVSGGCSLGGTDNSTLTITNASSTACVVTATRAAGGNYVAQTSTNYNVTLVKANSTISVNGPFSFTYNSSPQGPDTATVTGSGGAVTYSYVGTGSTTYGPSSTKPTDEGTYDVTATLAADNNYNGASSGATAFTIATPPSVTSFTLKTPATSPTNVDTLVFLATFSEDVAGVEATDFTVIGTTATISVAGVGAGPTFTQYDITVSGGDLAGLNGMVGVNLAVGQNITDLAGNPLPAGEPATDETYDVNNSAPLVASTNLSVAYTGAGPSSYVVTFSEDVDNTGGGTGTDDAANPNNYILMEQGSVSGFQTTACNNISAQDTRITPGGVTYIPNTVIVNFGSALPIGTYRIFVCGTTSIVDLAGNELNGGQSDYTFDFIVSPITSGTGPANEGTEDESQSIASSLPNTGFAPNQVTTLQPQPADLAYSKLGDIWLEIPALNVKSSIVGVPQNKDNTWNVNWLGNDTGWLNGTAFPSWEGNSVITAHTTDSNGLPGPFADLKKLKYGNQIIVHLSGQQYIFEVRNSRLARPYTTSFAFEHLEDHSFLTLITCQGYNPLSDSYLFRRVVRAVLVEVK